MKLISEDIESNLWNKLYNDYKFSPSTNSSEEWIKIPYEHKIYHKENPWDNEQESLVNLFLTEQNKVNCTL